MFARKVGVNFQMTADRLPVSQETSLQLMLKSANCPLLLDHHVSLTRGLKSVTVSIIMYLQIYVIECSILT